MTAETVARLPVPALATMRHESEADQRVRALVDRLDAIIWEVDAATLQCTFVNQRAALILGYPMARWLSEPLAWTNYLYAEDRDQVLAVCRAVLADGNERVCEHRCVAADGRVLWFRTTLWAQPSAEEPPRWLQGLMIELTAYKQTEERLRESEARYRFMTENSTDMIARHRLDGQYLYISPACYTLLGYTPEELIGRLPYELFHPDDLPAIREAHAAVLSSRETCTVTYRICRKDGAYLWFETTCRTIHDAATDAVLEIYTASRDVTERKRAEEERSQLFMREQRAQAEAEVLRNTDRLKSEFIARVSHELRTPLHHIKGYASTLLRPRLPFDPETVQEYLRIITEESDKLERLIVDLLDTSRIETGALTLDIDSVQLDDLVRKVVQYWQGIETHTFSLCIPDVVPPIPADPYRLEQVLNNLLANVVRHTPSHTLTTVSIDITREQVLVSVADQGPGIGPEHLPYLFDRFYQAEPQAYRRQRGSGLGLFICKGLIEQHGGSIWVELIPGAGTTFRFSLPRRRALTKHGAVPAGAGEPPCGDR